MSERNAAVRSPALGSRKRVAARSDKFRGTARQQGWTYLEAKFPFNYTNEQGRVVDIKRGDLYLLVKRTNTEWWQVLPFGLPRELVGSGADDLNEDVTSEHSFYIPAKYVVEVERPPDRGVPDRLLGGEVGQRGHRRQDSTGTNSSATPDWKDDSGASNECLDQQQQQQQTSASPSTASLPYPVPQPRSRKAGTMESSSPSTAAKAEFKANLEGKISSVPRQDVGLVRVSKASSLPTGTGVRNGPPSPPASSKKPVLLPSVPAGQVALRPTPTPTAPGNANAEAATPGDAGQKEGGNFEDDDVIYANIPPVGLPPPPAQLLASNANRHSSCMLELPGLWATGKEPGGAASESSTPSERPDRPQISGPIMVEGGGPLQSTEKRGSVSKTKLMENGKKVKKHWMQHFIILSGQSLFFYKDHKAATPKPGQPHGRPEMTLNLETVRVTEVDPNASRRKHVMGLEDRGAPGSSVVYLLEFNDHTRLQEWTFAINFSKDLAANRMYQHPESGAKQVSPFSTTLSPKRQRSFRKKNDSGSHSSSGAGGSVGGGNTTPTSVSMVSPERQTVISLLKEFFRKRPGVESLEAKGIWRTEPVFGSTLANLAEAEGNDGPPLFVYRCMEAIEKRDGMNVQGVYRVNGNGATIQRLRCLVDQSITYDLMDPEWDLEVLTGSLKLFFRELKEPLIPYSSYQKFVHTTTAKDKNRVSAMRKLINNLPTQNLVTMRALFQHLHKVVEHSSVNQMHPRNIAIVFGPNLLWPAPISNKTSGPNSEGLTATMMAQNQVVEFILSEAREFFPPPPPLPQRASLSGIA